MNDENSRAREEEVAELDAAVRRASGRRTRRSFLAATILAIGGYEFYQWLYHSPGVGRVQRPLRRVLQFDAKVARTVFDDRGLAPTYPRSKAVALRTNGDFGLKEIIAPENYRLQVVGVANAKNYPRYTDDVTAWDYRFEAPKSNQPGVEASTKEDPSKLKQVSAKDLVNGRRRRGQEEAGLSRSTLRPGTPGLLLTMDDVNRLPHRELITEFKCIEGWSQITQWGGVRLADFIAAYPPARNAKGELPRYVYMETPDGDYYCGFDMRVCMHPQSLLVTEMFGRPLEQFHGAPLRLHMPIKYGYKQIKRIGLIAYTDEKPDDYWTKLGYDWYAGL